MLQRRKTLRPLNSSISLLNVEAKIYLSAFARWMTTFLVANSYIDTTVQKGGVSGHPGCLEHNSIITQQLKEAREKKGNLALIWLDLANAYGSIPHRLDEKAVTLYHIPLKVQELVPTYYNNIKVRFTTKSFTTSPLGRRRESSPVALYRTIIGGIIVIHITGAFNLIITD